MYSNRIYCIPWYSNWFTDSSEKFTFKLTFWKLFDYKIFTFSFSTLYDTLIFLSNYIKLDLNYGSGKDWKNILIYLLLQWYTQNEIILYEYKHYYKNKKLSVCILWFKTQINTQSNLLCYSMFYTNNNKKNNITNNNSKNGFCVYDTQ